MAAWLVPEKRNADGTQNGQALDGGLVSQAEVGFDSLRIGEEYWLSLPQAANVSGEPVIIRKARFVSLPRGLKLLGYKLLDTADTDGYGIGVVTVNSSSDEFSGVSGRSKPFTVKAHEPAKFYYAARLKVTGSVTSDTSHCRFWYRQGSVRYRQDLRCVQPAAHSE
ncbi:hypothetical protein [Streptomyces sp. NPDC054842]